jgi:tetratricopeptide (TPR) repeat protein
MAGLTSEATKIIETASVEGQDFTAEVIALIHNMDLLTVLEILELELGRQHRFVEDVSASDVSFHNSTLSKFKFSHGYYQHLIYETRVGASRRRELHRRVGSALEQLWKGSEEAIGIQLAHHFELAGEAERAIKYYVLATQRGLALADFEAAALCAETGLRIAQQGVSAESENDVNSLYVAGATAARVRGDFRGAERIAREGLAHSAEGPLLIRLKLKSELARSLYNLDSNFAESESELRQAIALANELKDRRVGADLFRQLGIVFQRQGQFLDALEQYLTSLDSVEADLELMVTADAINAIGVAFALLGRAETAITFHNSALQLAGAQKNRSRDTLFLNDSCSPLRRLGRLEQVTDVTERSFRLAKDQGKIGALARAQYERAQVHRVQRKWREYGVALQDVLAHGSQLGTQSPQLRKARGELLLLSSLEPGLKLNLRVADELSALGEPGVTGTTEMHSVDYVSAILNYQSQDMANSLVHFRNVVEQITKMPGEPCWAWPFLRSLALFGISAITVSDESANTYKAAVKHLHRALAQFGETGVWHDVEFWGMVLSHVCGVTWPDVNSFITTGGSVVSESVTLLESRSLAELSRLTSLVPNLRAL